MIFGAVFAALTVDQWLHANYPWAVFWAVLAVACFIDEFRKEKS